MAHALDESTGRAAFAYAQSGGAAWHTLGTPLSADDVKNIDVCIDKAGLGYTVNRSAVRFAVAPSSDPSPDRIRSYKGKEVLWRSDTKAPLGLCTPQFEIYQPRQVAEMFREWITSGGGTMETLGALFGGAQYFASFKIGDAVNVVPGDAVMPYVFGRSGVDGKTPTEYFATGVRVVCDNTMRMALASDKLGYYRQTHKTAVNVQAAKATIEGALTQFRAYLDAARTLTRISVSSHKAADLTAKLLDYVPTFDDKGDETSKTPRGFAQILALFSGTGKGASIQGVKGTAWGWLNAVTEYTDHHVRAQNDENRFASAMTGAGQDMKQEAIRIALAA